MSKTETAVPDGYMKKADGSFVPVANIKPIDMARDALVKDIVGSAIALSKALSQFKGQAFNDVAAFVELSAEQYGANLGGEKGNVSLTTFDGRFKVLRAMQDTMVFDERLQAAKALIDTCLKRWSNGAQPEIHVLINDAFKVDQAGNINTARVLSLRRLQISDPEWNSAMDAIGESLSVSGSKSYLRIYERKGADGKYVAINLDMAAV